MVGENILAVQVHNDSIKGSDLTFNSSLLYFYNLNEYFIYQDQLRFIKQVQLDSTRFPIVSVQTGESGIASSSEKYIAHLSIISNQEGGYNRPSDIPTDYDGRISIELRGKTSLHWPKKSYNIETQNASGENLNVSLLGMPPENDWILQGPFGDKSLFRNVFAYMLGNKLGYYEPRTRFCELIINGEFLGLYVLTEKIKRDSLRVDIASLRPEDIAGSELTGGYIVKYDKDAPGLISVYPRKSVINITQWAYITGFFNDFYLVLDKPEFLDIQHGYKKYIDEQTLIDYIIVNESFRNCDAYKYSTYMHKDKDTRDARIKFGPLWDFDFSLGNVTYQDAHLTDGWQFEINKQLNITKVMRDTVFVKELKERWFDLRKGLFHPDTLKFLIDSLVNHIKVARERNYEVWPVIQYALTNYDHASTYEQELYNLKNFLMARTSWIDNDIRHIFYPALVFPSTLKSLHVSNHVVVYPNPFSDYLMVECKQAGQGSYLIEITDFLGRKVFEMRKDKLYSSNLSFTIRLSKLSSLTNGLYVISITYNDRVLFRERIMKQ